MVADDAIPISITALRGVYASKLLMITTAPVMDFEAIMLMLTR